MRIKLLTILSLLLLLASVTAFAQRPELVAQVGHTQAPHWLGFGLGGQILISAGDDHVIKVWDVRTSRLLLTIPFVSGGGGALDDNGGAFRLNQDGTLLAVRTSLDTIKVWDLSTGQLAHTVKTQSRAYSSHYEEIGLSADGRFLSRIFSDQPADVKEKATYSLQVWDLSSGVSRVSDLGKYSAYDFNTTDPDIAGEFSPDGRLLMLNIIDIKGEAVKGEVWDVVTGRMLYNLRVQNNLVPHKSGFFSEDGQALFVIDHGRIKVIESATGNEIQSIQASDAKTERLELIKASNDHKIIAAIIRTYDSLRGKVDRHTFKLWRTADGKELRRIALPDSGFDASALELTPDNRLLICRFGASQNPQLKVWDVAEGRERYTTKIGWYTNVTMSPDGKLMATDSLEVEGDSYHSSISLWNVDDGQKVGTISGYSGGVDAVNFSPDGKTLLSSIRDHWRDETAFSAVWNLRAGEVEQTIRGDFIALSQDGSRIVTQESIKTEGTAAKERGKDEAEQTRNQITVWDAETGQRIKTFEGNLDEPLSGYERQSSYRNDRLVITNQSGSFVLDINSARLRRLPDNGFLSPTGKYLAQDDSEKHSIEIYDLSTNRLFRVLRTGEDEEAYGWKLAFSPDDKYLVGASYSQSETKVWRVATGRLLRKFETANESADYQFNLAFSPDGQDLIVGGDVPSIWDLATGEKRKVEGTVNLPIALRYADIVFFSPHHKYMVNVAGGERSSICLWEVNENNGLSLRAKAVYDGSAAAISNDDRVLATISEDQLIKLWDIASGKPLGSIVLFGAEDWLVITPDGRFDGTPSAWNKIIWRFSQNILDYAPVEAFYNEFYRPGLLSDIMSGKQSPAPADISQKDRRQIPVRLKTTEKIGPKVSVKSSTVTIELEVEEAPAGPDTSDKKRMLSPSGARDLRLFRNGLLVKLWKGDIFALHEKDGCNLQPQASPQSPRRSICTVIVPIVAGENNFTAYVFNNDNVKSLDADMPTIVGDDSLKRPATLYLLAIGVGDSSNPAFKLNYAAQDARDFEEQVKAQQQKIGHYAKTEVTTITDDKATKESILAELKRLVALVHPEDGLVIYFSGHGTAQEKHFYMLPYDIGYKGSRTKEEIYKGNNLAEILSHSVSDQDLEDVLRTADAGQIVMVIDACNSGQALNADDPRRGPMNSTGLAQLAYEKGMYILTASQDYEVAYESNALGHSYLTYALVEEGLKTPAADKNGDKRVELREWLSYAVQRVPQMRQKKVEQSAKLQGKSLELVEVTEQGKVQTPRVFYRREPDAQPLVIAKVGVAR